MMELKTCALVVTLASLATATPYGYGVKGGAGAAAGAEASASAGAFGGRGDMPVGLPFGNGFSGSFSKSSSSSSSSSSASSSSSSSSFSYNGAGAFPGAVGGAGCGGGCQTSGANEILANHGAAGAGHGSAGLQAYSGANAAAVAGSGATPGAGCQGAACAINSGKCSSGNCQQTGSSPTGPGHISPTGSSHNQPTSGCNSPNCLGETPSTGINAPPNYGSNKPSHNAEDKQPTYTGGFGGPPGMLKPNEFNPGTGLPTHSANPAFNKPSTAAECTSPNCFGSSPVAGVTPSGTSYGIHKPSEGVTVSSEKQPSSIGFGDFGPSGTLKPHDTHFGNPSYSSHVPTSAPSTGCKTSNCAGYTPAAGVTAAANAQSGSYGATKPNASVDSPNKLPPYTGGFGGAAGILNPSEFKVPHTAPGYNPAGISPNKIPANNNLGGYPSSAGTTIGANPQPAFGVTQPSVVHPSSVTAPGSTSNYDRPVGVTNPSAPAVAPISGSHSSYPTSSYPAGCTTPNCAPHSTNGISVDVNAPSGPHGVTVPSSKPTYPQYPTGFGGPSGSYSPSGSPSFGSNNSNCKNGNCANGAGPGAHAHAGAYSDTKPGYTGGFGGPSGSYSPSGFPSTGSDYSSCKNGNCASGPSTAAGPGGHPTTGALSNLKPGYTGSFGGPSGSYSPSGSPSTGGDATNCINGNCANGPSGATGPGAHPQAGKHPDSKPDYTGGFGGPSGLYSPSSSPLPGSDSAHCKNGNCANGPSTATGSGAHPQAGAHSDAKPAYTGGFGGPSGSYSPNGSPSAGSNAANCINGNCANGPSAATGPGALPHAGAHSDSKPGYTGGFERPSGSYSPSGSPLSVTDSTNCKYGNCANAPLTPSGPGVHPQVGAHSDTKPGYTGGFGGPSGLYSPSGSPSTGSDSATCKNGNCANGPSAASAPGTHPQSGAHPNLKPGYTGGFGGPSGFYSPSGSPSAGSDSTNCKTGNCASGPLAAAGAGAHTQAGANAGSKPAYTGGFGAPSGLLNPNDYSIPANTPTSSNLHKPAGSTPVSCTSGNCGPKAPSSSPGYSAAGSGAHASASSHASANAVAYAGGFGGPPGFLKPYDDGKVDISKLVDGQNLGLHDSGANINSPHTGVPGVHGIGVIPNGGAASPTGSQSNLGALAGSAAGATSYSNAVASAGAGSLGYNSAHKPGVKGGSPCGGGCGGAYQDGANSSAAASAKSLASSGAFGAGGSFASSSASAHSGAYTKGGYGK